MTVPLRATVDLVRRDLQRHPGHLAAGRPRRLAGRHAGDPERDGTVTTASAGDGAALRLVVTSPDQGDVLVSYLDTPERAARRAGGGRAERQDPRHFSFPGSPSVPQRFAVLERAAVLPRAGEHGLLFDLDLAVPGGLGTAGPVRRHRPALRGVDRRRTPRPT